MTEDPIQSVLAAVPDPMLHIGADGTITHANDAALGLLGDWILGRSHDVALRQPALQTPIAEVLRGADRAEARIERPDPSGVTDYRIAITALGRSPDRGLLLHMADITHLRDAEAMRRDFVANVSHELRTPLTALIGFIDTLGGPARDDPAARARFLGIMKDEAQRMNRLVSDLLSLSRVEAEERVRPQRELDLEALLRDTLAALQPAAAEAGNALGLDLDDSARGRASRLHGDRDQLMQVFLNLTENALKYGGPGKPVTLRLGRGEGRGPLKGPMLRVDVTDRGEGIDSLHLPRLTERFYRVDAHRSRELGGTGLGLAIVKHILNRHRGRLSVTSDPGRGSTFTVHLPAI